MRVTFIVPTLGHSPWLGDCLAAVRRDAGREDRIWVVDQGPQPQRSLDCHRHLRLETNLGFAGGCNHALGEVESTYAALINDDALIELGWTETLVGQLEERADVASVQGLNLRLDAPQQVDGGGLAWNRWWQAVQLGHQCDASEMPPAPAEVFGVSATAAIYRHEALRQVALDDGSIFDPRLFAYYEDVDLAIRLRAAGFRALRGDASARHAGSITGDRLGGDKVRWLTRNRVWVVARLLGTAFPSYLPTLRQRELRDLAHDLASFDFATARSRVSGWREATRGLDGFAHDGPPLVPIAELIGAQKDAA